MFPGDDSLRRDQQLKILMENFQPASVTTWAGGDS